MEERHGYEIFVGNLHSSVTKELLLELFGQAGPVLYAQIPKDYNGRNRSYGFIGFKNRSSCSYAQKIFRGTRLFGKELAIKEKHSRNRNNNR